MLYTFLYAKTEAATEHHSSSKSHIEIERDHVHNAQSQLVKFCKAHNLDIKYIDKEVSDDHILEIYPQLENWKRVAAYLGLTQADVEAIEGRARPGKPLMRLYMLQEWKKKKRLHDSATYQVLLEALIKCDCTESAIKVSELLS